MTTTLANHQNLHLDLREVFCSDLCIKARFLQPIAAVVLVEWCLGLAFQHALCASSATRVRVHKTCPDERLS